MKCGVWRVQCEVWSMKKAVRSEKCRLWVGNVKCGVLRVQCKVKRGVRRVQCEVWSVKSAVRSVKCEVEPQMWHVKQDTTFAECTHARAWLAHGACKFYRWEKSYKSLRQLPPRLARALLASYKLRKKEISAPGWKPAGGLVILLPTSKTDNNQAVNAEALRDVSIVMWRQGRHNLISCLQFKSCLKVSCLNGVFWKPRGHWGHQDHTKWIGAESPKGEQRIPKDSSRVLWAEPCSVLASFSCAFLTTLYFMIWVCFCMIPHIRHDPNLQDFIICCFGRFSCSPVPGKSVQRNATKCCWRHALWHVVVDMLVFNW